MTGGTVTQEPIPMRLPCPSCGALHIDEGEFATEPHHTHACQSCGMVWRPAVVATVGVQFLPGYRNEESGAPRDARQDPQPASEPWPWGDEGFMCPKMVRETLCVAQAAVGRSLEVDARRVEHVERISRLINLCDRHRPLGPDGKHGTRQCTPTCGCEDKREPTTPVEPAVEPDTSDTLDFDAMPIGTVLWDSRDFLLRLPGGWTYNPPADENDYYDIENDGEPFTVVYQPAPVSPAEGLRAVLAGRGDADELIEYAATSYRSDRVLGPGRHLLSAVGDAARSGGAT